MDVFRLRDTIIDRYSDFVTSFVRIKDPALKAFVAQHIDSESLWPEPLIQLNPAFQNGGWIDELVAEGLLHKECSKVFRVKDVVKGIDKPLRLHKHQVDGLRKARERKNYVLTTGTGSGKSLSYIVPIVDHVLRTGPGRGVQAIVVYPMNALCNSQYGELRKFLQEGYAEGKEPVRFAKYTGQESQDERQLIVDNPPDIILTNYVMLELLLTRPFEKKLVAAAAGLSFLVLDELHTYRGRQGADVALLVRRVREACRSPQMLCVGTSATMSSAAHPAMQKQQIAEVASRLFGADVAPDAVVAYYAVWKSDERGGIHFEARELNERIDEPPHREAGFLYRDPANPWPQTDEEIIQRLPDDWLDEAGAKPRLRKSLSEEIPVTMRISTAGELAGNGLEFQYTRTPFRFCLGCGVSYRVRRGASDFAQLSTLASGGRSSATTILGLTAVQLLKQETTLSDRAKKLLSFTDNRQDASLQAGHFNDFIEVSLLRAALFKAVSNNPEGIDHDELPLKVFRALNLDFALYAREPGAEFALKNDTEKAFRNVLAYRLYRDLRRGWRIASPNLEQCGLLQIHYGLALSQAALLVKDAMTCNP